MKKIVWVCGVIAGLISVSWCILSVNFLKGLSLSAGLLLGYATMVLGFSLIYVGVKNYRDNLSGGLITFGKAMKVSLLITLVASTVYVAIWLVDYYLFIPDFGKHYQDMVRKEMVADHASAKEIQKQMDDISQMSANMKNPLYNMAMVFCEIAPVGVVISLIVSLILKRKTPPVLATA